MDTTEKRRVGILDMQINVWMPLSDGQPYLAKIGDTPMLFKGSSPFAVTRAADNWRREEVAKHERQRENAQRRAEALRAAREAKKAAQEGEGASA